MYWGNLSITSILVWRKRRFIPRGVIRHALLLAVPILLLSCDLIQRKKENDNGTERPAIARVDETYLYRDELTGIVPAGTPKEDSTSRADAYINSWIRKQLLIRQAGRQN
jgi:hypothetical protein